MIVTKDTHLLNLKLAFSELFPHLKIEFFTQEHEHHQLSSIATEMLVDKTVAELNPNYDEAHVFTALPDEQVSHFEDRMKSEFGLNVQVFRKSGHIWIQTSKTDDWTLRKQEETAVMSLADVNKD